MDNRTDSFVRKFKNAQLLLKAGSIHEIVSLKYRESCVNNSEYVHFIDHHLRNELGLEIRPVNGDFWGKAWIIAGPNRSKIILVEHETGLEILYVAGSIASLIALIPVINAGWKWFRNNRGHAGSFRSGREEMEVRRINAKNAIVEQPIQNIEVFLLSASLEENAVLHDRVRLLEKEVAAMKKAIKPKSKTNPLAKEKTKK
jgi:hypothetical protein